MFNEMLAMSSNGGGIPNIYFYSMKSRDNLPTNNTHDIGFKPKKIYTFSYYALYGTPSRSCVYDEDVSKTDITVYIENNDPIVNSIGTLIDCGEILSINDTIITFNYGVNLSTFGFIAIG